MNYEALTQTRTPNATLVRRYQ